jgi:hypothetical protein
VNGVGDTGITGSLKLNNSKRIYLGTTNPLSFYHTGTYMGMVNDTGNMHFENGGATASMVHKLGSSDANTSFVVQNSEVTNNEIFKVDGTGVIDTNGFEIEDSTITAQGAGTNIDIDLVPKGTGEVRVSRYITSIGTSSGFKVRDRASDTERWAIYSAVDDGDLRFYSFTNPGNIALIEEDGTVGSLNFTGVHKCCLKNDTDVDTYKGYRGRIVSSSGSLYNCFNIDNDNPTKPQVSESLPEVELSNIEKDKKVFGVIGGLSSKTISVNEETLEEKEVYKFGWGSFTNTKRLSFSERPRFDINSVGEGGILCSNKNGNIENGDYICSSSVPGVGMLQDSDTLHNYTVAKSLQNEDFTSDYDETEDGVRYKLIGCTYHCG